MRMRGACPLSFSYLVIGYAPDALCSPSFRKIGWKTFHYTLLNLISLKRALDAINTYFFRKHIFGTTVPKNKDTQTKVCLLK